MFIVMTTDEGNQTDTFETKKEAFDFAKEYVTNRGGSANVYKANLIGIAETAVTINKVRKARVPKKEVFEPAMAKVVNKQGSKKPVLDPDLQIIAAEQSIAENDIPIPIGARCALDSNMAVGRKKGPTGEYVYLCIDCMGVIGND